MDPQQELFTAIRSAVMKKGYDVYDGALPPENTPYPFIYLADSRQNDDYGNKNVILADVYQDIHIWHNDICRRGTVSEMIADVKAAVRKISHTAVYSWAVREIEQQIITDTTTTTPLVHGIVTVHFKLTGGRA